MHTRKKCTFLETSSKQKMQLDQCQELHIKSKHRGFIKTVQSRQSFSRDVKKKMHFIIFIIDAVCLLTNNFAG